MRLSARQRHGAVGAGVVIVVALLSGGRPAVGQGSQTTDTTALAAQEMAVVVQPAAGLVDLQPVTVTGVNFAPSAALSVSQCNLLDGLSAGICHGASRREVMTDAAGAFSLTVYGRRVIVEATAQVDCASAPGACGLVTNDPATGQRATGPVAFDPARPATPPVVAVKPGTALADGETVTVTGRGFVPGTSLKVGQCLDEGYGLQSCDVDSFVELAADHDGRLESAYTVRSTIRPVLTGMPGRTPQSCAGTTRCVLAVANGVAPSEHARAPLAFKPVVLGETVTRPGTGTLPRTGPGPAGPLALLGAALLAVGTVLRKSRPAASPALSR